MYAYMCTYHEIFKECRNYAKKKINEINKLLYSDHALHNVSLVMQMRSSGFLPQRNRCSLIRMVRYTYVRTLRKKRSEIQRRKEWIDVIFTRGRMDHEWVLRCARSVCLSFTSKLIRAWEGKIPFDVRTMLTAPLPPPTQHRIIATCCTYSTYNYVSV